MIELQDGTAVIDNSRPFGPQCLYKCPNGHGICSVDVQPTKDAKWENVGTNEAPTLIPSIKCERCPFHGYIQKGKIEDAPPVGISTQIICRNCKEPHIVTVIPQMQLQIVQKA